MSNVPDLIDSETHASDGPPAAEKTTVFLSYSRADGDFLVRLAAALGAAGYRANYDTAPVKASELDIGISSQDEWWQRLQEMIIASEVMVLLVSPDSAISRVVDEEIAFARAEGKRIVSVLCRPVDFNAATPRVSALNVKISFVDTSADAFARSLAELCEAIDQDIAWLRKGRALGQEANDWKAASLGVDRLLRGGEIAEAESWSARRPATAPPVSELLLAFIAESRTQEENRARKEREQLARQRTLQRRIAILIGAAVLATLAGAGFVLDRQRELARSESVMLARVAEELFTQGDYVRATRLASLGARRDLLRPGSAEADAVFDRAVRSPMLEREFDTSVAVVQLWTSADGRLAGSVGSSGSSFDLWRTDTGESAINSNALEPMSETGFSVGPQGRQILLWNKSLLSDHAFLRPKQTDPARRAVLWALDAQGRALGMREQRYPVHGGLLLGGSGSIVTWSERSLAAWSADFSVRASEVRLPAPVEMVQDAGDGRRLIVALEGGRLELWGVDPSRKSAALTRLAAKITGASVRELVPVPEADLILVVTTADELLAVEMGTLAVRYRGVKQACCFGPPEVKVINRPGAPLDRIVATFDSAQGQEARLIRLETGRQVGPVFKHSQISGARFDANGGRLVTYGVNKEAYVWDVASGEKQASLTHLDRLGAAAVFGPPVGMQGASFVSDEEIAIWNDDGTIRMHDTRTGKQIGGHMRHGSGIRHVRVLPDRRLLTAANGPMRMWRLPDLKAPIKTVEDLCKSPWPGTSMARLTRSEAGGSAFSQTEQRDGLTVLAPTMRIDEEDERIAPILRGRLGENVCPD